MKRRMMALVIGLCFSLLGCSAGETDRTPREIDPTIDVCPVCRMTVIDERFAAQTIDSQGQVEIFDDIGCLSIFMRRLEAGKKNGIAAAYVKDFESVEWLSAQEAFYVQGRIDTPMSFGIVAFADEETARKFAEEAGGRQMTWEQVLTEQLTIGLDIEFNQEEFNVQNRDAEETREEGGN
ncbi:nitrous oxide reductase accessory protein NosL [Desulfosporosinus youngiae]|uniref:Putative lipoprotein involved in nitrous oxide reduction n=1 Tax=Desulfosporosinus youngiae DSM 17734 TaxID=768710 RepID=H5XXP2_9FIRM|nr:nitrous oxide reductase accessory protein NosL [Desulfosporosinus youngiae]EHQ91321.1 putative lipoprotein involved in nitrous oxide reduction [Desulfosporosinus youngiae DSM 17734]